MSNHDITELMKNRDIISKSIEENSKFLTEPDLSENNQMSWENKYNVSGILLNLTTALCNIESVMRHTKQNDSGEEWRNE
jgi:hypothetical protein